MNTVKELGFDLLKAKIKARNQSEVFKVLAEDAAPLCGVDVTTLSSEFVQRLDEGAFGIGDGVALFDVTSSHIKSSVLAILTFDRDIDIGTLDGESVNIMAVVLSPKCEVQFHLQRLAGVSRVLHSHDLCEALREVNDEDAMRMLFMQTQDWMIAA